MILRKRMERASALAKALLVFILLNEAAALNATQQQALIVSHTSHMHRTHARYAHALLNERWK